MNYQKVYNQLVERAKTRTKPDCYTEIHHIIPRCLGGSDDSGNLVTLTAREHFICHWLLSRIYPEHRGLAYAFNMMCNVKLDVRYIPSSIAYSEARERFSILRKGLITSEETCKKISKTLSGRKLTKEHSNNKKLAQTGLKRSEEIKNKFSEIQKQMSIDRPDIAEKRGLKLRGKKRTEEQKTYISQRTKEAIALKPISKETRKKISESQKGKKRSDEAKKKMSDKAKGRKMSDEAKQKLKEINIGKKASEETRKKLSELHKGKKHNIVSCPYCNKAGGLNSMTRWHFDNCKHKPKS
jgi:hypothetical protein